MTGQLEVLRAGLLTTVQDAGRRGLAHLGVPRSGAVDGPSFRLANRLVGNPETAAALETTMDGVTVRLATARTVAVTGAMCSVTIDGIPVNWGLPQFLRAGQVLGLGPALSGLRSYLAVSGGIAVQAVLDSRSTDLLSGLGPGVLRVGHLLALGTPTAAAPVIDVAPYPQVGDSISLRIVLGPRHEWLAASDLRRLPSLAFRVSSTSNRIAFRLEGPTLTVARCGELLSEGIVCGAVQLPRNGQPLVFLADHPTTGGYPVIGVVVPEDLPAGGQARPGGQVRLIPV